MSSRSSGIQNEMLCPTNNPEFSLTPEAPKTTAPTQTLPGSQAIACLSERHD